MVPDLGSSRGESSTTKVGSCPRNVQERLAGVTQQATGWVIGYKVIQVSWLLSGKDLVG